MTACLSEADAKLILKSIDSFIANCDKPAATCQVRETYGCTWDEALSVIANWNIHSLVRVALPCRVETWVSRCSLMPAGCHTETERVPVRIERQCGA